MRFVTALVLMALLLGGGAGAPLGLADAPGAVAAPGTQPRSVAPGGDPAGAQSSPDEAVRPSVPEEARSSLRGDPGRSVPDEARSSAPGPDAAPAERASAATDEVGEVEEASIPAEQPAAPGGWPEPVTAPGATARQRPADEAYPGAVGARAPPRG
ncbi:hypothetical protein [Plantactinospora sp. CA-290183]|uniref:hypothetical protein n=1 Tax=Plantactinospora sp. CA-290183 TaxID=3240006 RepID=UPI003D918614